MTLLIYYRHVYHVYILENDSVNHKMSQFSIDKIKLNWATLSKCHQTQ